jgi:uncharacterized protein YaeQ
MAIGHTVISPLLDAVSCNQHTPAPLPRSAVMALKATIFKAGLQVADLDRQYFADHALTIARHPSETDERMMVRILAFACHANEALAFGKGLSDVDEPDISLRDLTGAIDQWIEVGQPDEKRILRACGRARSVSVYAYGPGAEIWWRQLGPKLERTRNLEVLRIPAETARDLAALARRTMNLQCTIQEGRIWIGEGERTVQADPVTLLSRPVSAR